MVSFSSWIVEEVKRTIQKYLKHTRPKRARGQNWKTFLRHHAAEVWACDFLQVTDLWVAQQLREATPYGQTPTYLIRENERKLGPNVARVATSSGIKVLRTPYRTPRANAR